MLLRRGALVRVDHGTACLLVINELMQCALVRLRHALPQHGPLAPASLLQIPGVAERQPARQCQRRQQNVCVAPSMRSGVRKQLVHALHVIVLLSKRLAGCQACRTCCAWAFRQPCERVKRDGTFVRDQLVAAFRYPISRSSARCIANMASGTP